VKVYGTVGGGSETLLATLDASMISGIVGTQASPRTFTAMDGNTYSGALYWGNSGVSSPSPTPNYLDIYINVQMSDSTTNITKVVFGGNYMEFDNVTTSTVWQSSIAAATIPTVTAISPSSGSSSGGTSVTITGTNFVGGQPPSLWAATPVPRPTSSLPHR